MRTDFLVESKSVRVSLLAAQGDIKPPALPCVCRRPTWGQLGCSQPSPGAHRDGAPCSWEPSAPRLVAAGDGAEPQPSP